MIMNSEYDAVSFTGRQHHSDGFSFWSQISPVWRCDSGSLIPVDNQQFIGIDEILHKLQQPFPPL